MDTVLETVNGGVAADGARKRPNLTFVNFPNVDSAGHASGTTSGPYDTAIGLVDAELGRFVANQKAQGLWERTVVVVVSDHSMDTTLGRTSLSQRFAAAGVGDGVVVSQNGSVDMVYLENRSAAARFEKLKALRATALGSSGVDEALYREPNPADGGVAHTLDFVHPAWRIAGERTGDLLVTHKAEGAFSDPVNPLVGNHGGPQTTDNMFAVLGGDPAIRQQTVGGTVGPRFDDALLNPGSAQNVDVAPTVMALLGLGAPAQSEGRALAEAFAPGTFAAAAAAAGAASTADPVACRTPRALRSASVRPRGRRGLQVRFSGALARSAVVDVFRTSSGRSVLGNRRVARLRRTRSFAWSGRRGGDGTYVVRVRLGADERRFVLQRTRGRFRVRPAAERRPSCGLLARAKLTRPVFGGRDNRALGISFRVRREARVFAEVLRRGRVVRRFAPTTRRPGVTHRLRLPSEGLRRGEHRVRLTVTVGRQRVVATLTARRL
jgi:hypothetical protein